MAAQCAKGSPEQVLPHPFRHSGGTCPGMIEAGGRNPEVSKSFLDAGFHWKLLLRFQLFRHPWLSRRHDGLRT